MQIAVSFRVPSDSDSVSGFFFPSQVELPTTDMTNEATCGEESEKAAARSLRGPEEPSGTIYSLELNSTSTASPACVFQPTAMCSNLLHRYVEKWFLLLSFFSYSLV